MISWQAISLVLLCCYRSSLQKLLNAPESASVYDPVKASHWLNEAARQNHTDSQLLLASKLESTDPLQSFRWYEAAAKGGNAQAQYIVGLAHVRNTVPVDPATASAAPSDLLARLSIAARWFALAADHGHALAQTRLGFLCYHGVGTKQDESTGLMWLGNAAEGVSEQTHAHRAPLCCAACLGADFRPCAVLFALLCFISRTKWMPSFFSAASPTTSMRRSSSTARRLPRAPRTRARSCRPPNTTLTRCSKTQTKMSDAHRRTQHALRFTPLHAETGSRSQPSLILACLLFVRV